MAGLYHYCSVAQSCLTLCNPWTVAYQASLSFIITQRLLKFMSIESVMPSNHLVLCCLLLLLPSVFPSTRVFSNESVLCIRWPKYWTFSISPSNEYSGLISFRMDCLDILAIQGTLKSPRDSQESSPTPQFKNINSLVLSFLYSPTLTSYMTTGKAIALTISYMCTYIPSLSDLPPTPSPPTL